MAFADGLRVLWMEGLVKAPSSKRTSTEAFLNPRSITVNGVTPTGDVTLFISNPKKTIAYFSQEADRFASAAFESLITVAKHENYPRSIGWLLIRGYYSAFFALHSLLRIHGWACTKITKNSTQPINEELSALFPTAASLTQGLYLLRSAAGGTEIVLRKIDPGQGGSHEALWGVLLEFFEEISTTVLTHCSPEDAQLVDGAIDDFLKIVKNMGGPVWFTRVRNKINYAHDYGAWFPYLNSTCDNDRLLPIFDRWRLAPNEVLSGVGPDELVKFASACSFIVSMCNSTIFDLTYRSPPKSPFRESSGRLSYGGRA